MTITSATTEPQVRHSTPRLGAEITGLRLADGVDESTAGTLRDLFRSRKVLVFRDQHLTPDEHVAAVSIFAEPFDHPTASRHADNRLAYPYDAQRHGKASRWHIGGLWREPVFKIESLVYETVPDTGGDTLWADLEAAYDGLSPAFQRLLAGVGALYDANPQNYSQGADRTPSATTVEHPLVRVDPDTGRPSLFLSTSAIALTGVTPAEGQAILPFLLAHASSPTYSVRYSWRSGDFALWDNQRTWHYAVDDYGTAPRTYRKVIGVERQPVASAVVTASASPVDTATFGHYRIPRDPGDRRPLYRFEGRISTDGSTPFHAEPGRYHLYAGRFCPWAQRTVITRSLAGLDGVVSLSYVHGERDGRGWAFREPTGPDPVNGFTLLRDAYDATEARFDGHVSVPTLWDRARGVVVSNEYRTIGIDLATRFRHLATPVVCTYPARLAGEIEELDAWLGPAVNKGVGSAAGADEDARHARTTLRRAFAELDGRLATSRYLLGNVLTEADVRLWVTLVRFDVGPNAGRDIVGGLTDYPNLWAYARDLYALPAFRDSTDFASFTRPGAVVADWDEPAHRGTLHSTSAA